MVKFNILAQKTQYLIDALELSVFKFLQINKINLF